MTRKNYNTREQEFIQDGIIINEYQEGKAYSEKESTKEYLKERQEENESAFFIGEPLRFPIEDIEIVYPAKLDKDNKPVTETDEAGNTFPVPNTEKRPIFKFVRRYHTIKAYCKVYENEFIEMLENLAVVNESARDVLETCFPCDLLDFGTFTEKGDRHFDTSKTEYLAKSGIVCKTFPVLYEQTENGHKKGQAVTNEFPYNVLDTKTGEIHTYTVTLAPYYGTQIKGCRIGLIKK